MKFGLQEYAVYCFNSNEYIKTFYNVMATSPEDACFQLKIRGLEPISWITEEAYGDY